MPHQQLIDEGQVLDKDITESNAAFFREHFENGQMELMQVAADKAENRKNDWDRLEEFFRRPAMNSQA